MIYAVNKRTKEHQVSKPATTWDGYEWDLVKADADGWIEWEGDKGCPIPDGSQCEILIGTRYTYARVTDPRSLTWREVRAYRPILDDTPQAPEWNGEGLPPVGAVCEALWNESRMEYLRTEVFGVDEYGQPIHRFEEGPKKHQYQADVLVTSSGVKVFRPIRTDREKWIDQATDLALQPGNAAGNVYDALKSGKLPQP